MIEGVFTLATLVARRHLVLSDGYRTRSDQLGKVGIPILRVSDVLDGRVEPSFKDHIRESYRPKMGPKLSRAGDVLITTKGTVGRVARVPDGMPEHSYSPQLCFLRSTQPAILDPLWLYQWARSPEFLNQIGIVKDQTDMAPYVSLTDLRRVQLTLPQVDEQRRIAGVLCAFDDLIDATRAEAERLVALAQAALSGGDADTVIVADAAALSRGLSYQGSGLVPPGTGGSRPMVNLANFTSRGWSNTNGLKYYSGRFREQHLLSEQDLLIANTDLTQRREILGRAVLVPPSLEGAIHSHHTSVVRFTRDNWLRMFLWAQSQGAEFRERAMGFATGTTVAALPKEAVLDFAIRLPANPEQVAAAAGTLVLRAWSCEEEIAGLMRTRDELLPLLMAGKVRVPDSVAVA